MGKPDPDRQPSSDREDRATNREERGQILHEHYAPRPIPAPPQPPPPPSEKKP